MYKHVDFARQDAQVHEQRLFATCGSACVSPEIGLIPWYVVFKTKKSIWTTLVGSGGWFPRLFSRPHGRELTFSCDRRMPWLTNERWADGQKGHAPRKQPSRLVPVKNSRATCDCPSAPVHAVIRSALALELTAWD